MKRLMEQSASRFCDFFASRNDNENLYFLLLLTVLTFPFQTRSVLPLVSLSISLSHDMLFTFQNRGHVVHHSSAAQFKSLDLWLQQHRSELCSILIPERLVLFGEWCYAQHSILYTALPNYFIAFDIYDRVEEKFYSVKRRNKLLERTTIPVIASVQLAGKTIRSMSSLATMCFNTPSHYYEGRVEGLYVRLDDVDNRWNLKRGKVVSPDFIQTINDGSHWMSKDLVKNTVVDRVVPSSETKQQREQYPRTPHVSYSPGGTPDDLRCTSISHLLKKNGDGIVITEKLDGGNCMIRDGKVYARSHGQEAKHPSFSRVKELARSLSYNSKLQHLCLYGENMQAIHSIDYHGLSSFFYLFAVRDTVTKRWHSFEDVLQLANEFNLHTVPVIYQSNAVQEVLSERQIEHLLTRRATEPSSVSSLVEPEGFVIRVNASFTDSEFPDSIAKYVRQNHIQTDDTWRRTWKKQQIL
jgi:hypothetical protein